jgi:hypothetical protein
MWQEVLAGYAMASLADLPIGSEHRRSGSESWALCVSATVARPKREPVRDSDRRWPLNSSKRMRD